LRKLLRIENSFDASGADIFVIVNFFPKFCVKNVTAVVSDEGLAAGGPSEEELFFSEGKSSALGVFDIVGDSGVAGPPFFICSACNAGVKFGEFAVEVSETRGGEETNTLFPPELCFLKK
jgi:hypothetical protein